MPRPAFKRHRSRHDGVTIHAVVGGDGPALQLRRPFLQRADAGH